MTHAVTKEVTKEPLAVMVNQEKKARMRVSFVLMDQTAVRSSNLQNSSWRTLNSDTLKKSQKLTSINVLFEHFKTDI